MVGAGRLGSSLVKGMLRAGLPKESIFLSDKDPEKRKAVEKLGVRVSENNVSLARSSDVIFLAVKPKELDGVLDEIKGVLGEKLLISPVAGVPMGKIEEKLRGAKIVRLMPNLACAVGEGVMVYSLSPAVGESERETVESLFAKLGLPIEVREDQMDVVTGLSGSGPAYFSLVIQALVEGAEELGMRREEALRLASQTAKGTGEMLLKLGLKPDELKKMVSSPGGTTEAGLRELERAKVFEAFKKALTAAVERAKELGSG